mmetsp:Transcript_25045/g.70598  ORF Transcript_25045/g.70598 Transcript_25045/m.70598 type:complete len:202 (+) Transcript_25045:1718-2323(+)
MSHHVTRAYANSQGVADEQRSTPVGMSTARYRAFPSAPLHSSDTAGKLSTDRCTTKVAAACSSMVGTMEGTRGESVTGSNSAALSSSRSQMMPYPQSAQYFPFRLPLSLTLPLPTSRRLNSSQFDTASALHMIPFGLSEHIFWLLRFFRLMFMSASATSNHAANGGKSWSQRMLPSRWSRVTAQNLPLELSLSATVLPLRV